MPLYEISGPDGKLYQIEGPEGASRDQIINAIQSRMQAQQAYLPETATRPADTTTFGGHAKEFLKGLGAGAVGLAETAGTGFAAMLPEKIEKQGREAMKENLAGVKEYLAPEKGYEDAISTNLGRGLGSTIPFAFLGPLGMAGRVASVGLGGAAGAGEARQRAEAAGVTGGDRGMATAAGILPGLLDFLPFSAAQKAVGVVSRALIAGGVEGATEAAQEIAQNAIAKGIYKPDQALLEGSGEAAGYGGAVGAMAQALVDSALHIKRRGAKTAPPPPPEEKPAGIAALPHYANPTMVTFPDGTTSSDPEVIRQYRQQMREESTGVMPSGPTAPGAELQGQLFTEEAAPPAAAPQRFTEQDNARLEELAAKPNLTGDEQQEFAYLMVSKDAAEATPTEAAPAQGQAAVQPDMVQEAEAKQAEELYAQDAARAAEETKQIEDMYAQEEREPVVPGVDIRADTAALEALVPAKGERQARQEQQKAAAAERQLRAEEQKLADLEAKMAADVAATDARVAQAQELKAAPQPTTPEMPAVEAPMQLFRAVKPGYKGGNTIKDGVYMTPNEAEARMFAGEKGTVTPVETTAAALISGATPIAPQITGKTLDSIGIPKAAPIRKRLEGKMQSDPTVQKDLSELSQNPNLPPAIQQNVTSFLATGTVATPVEPIKETPSAVTRPEPTRVGVSPESTVGERGERRAPAPSAARTEAPKATGLETTKRVSVQPTKREGKAQPAVKETREEREAKEQKVALNEWDEQLNKLLQTSSGPTLAELIAAKKSKKLEGPLALVPDVPAEVQTQLKGGDLKGALTNLAGKLDGIAGRITRQLANAIGETKVEVVDNLKDEAGNPVAGLFDPNTNTIKLDSKAGLSSHTVLHESVHAATSHVLDNKSHPVTRQLQQLFDDVKGSLDTAYGATSLDEFVAEAFSNPEFQAKLQAINPKGEPVTAWQRFTNTIKNFLRRMVGMEPTSVTAMDEADKLISAIMSPSPATRDAGSLYMMSVLGKGEKFFAENKEAFDALPIWNNKFAAKAREVITNMAPTKAKEFVESLLPLHAVTDLAKEHIADAPKVNDLVNEKNGYEKELQDQLHATVQDLHNVVGKFTEAKQKDLFYAINESTLAGVDVTKSEAEALKNFKGTKEERAEFIEDYRRIKPVYERLGSDGQGAYRVVFGAYSKLLKEIEDALLIRLEDLGGGHAAAAKVRDELYSRLVEAAGRINPYAALGRSGGKYRLSYSLKNPETGKMDDYKQHFDTEIERKNFVRELKQAGGQFIQEYGAYDKYNYRSAPPSSFVKNVLDVLDQNTPEGMKVDEESKEQILRMFVEMLPESSFAKGFQKRQGYRGFDENSINTLAKKGNSIIRQMSNIKYGAKLSGLEEKIDESVKTSGNDPVAIRYADALKKHIRFANNPNLSTASKLIRSVTFGGTLGFNVSTAILNAAQVPMIVMPYLSGKHKGGIIRSGKALLDAGKLLAKTGFRHDAPTFVETVEGGKTIKTRAFLSIDNIFAGKDLKDVPEELRWLAPLHKVAMERGQLRHSQTQDVLNMDETDSLWAKVNNWQGMFLRYGENINREVTLVAAYKLALEDAAKAKGVSIEKLSDAEKLEIAKDAIFTGEMTNGGIAAAAAPRIAQSDVGAVAFMYKRYGMTMYYLQFKLARQALKDADPKVRKEAMRQMAGIVGTAAVFSGVRGLPMFGLVAMIYNLFKGEDDDDLETATRKAMPYWMSRGLVNSIAGIEFGGRTAQTDLMFRDPLNAEDLPLIQRWAETFGGPAVGLVMRWDKGIEKINDGQFERGLEQLLPSAVSNVFKATRYATEGARTLRGDPITGEIGPWNVFAQGFGFAPAELIRQQEETSRRKRLDKEANQERSKLLKKYNMAMRQGDTDEMVDLLQDMNKFSIKHPQFKIDGKTLKNSRAQFERTTATMYHGVAISKPMRAEIENQFNSFDKGWDLFD